MNTLLLFVVILIVFITMTIVGFRTFKGISDALEGNRKLLEHLQQEQKKQAIELDKLVKEICRVSDDLKVVIEQFQTEKFSIEDFKAEPTSSDCQTTMNNSGIVKTVAKDNGQQNRFYTFYAKAYEYEDRLTVEAKDYDDAASTLPFKIEAKGNLGKMEFNKGSYNQVSENVNVLVFPFCNVNMTMVGKPQSIENVEAGEVELRNGEWVITRKPSIKIV